MESALCDIRKTAITKSDECHERMGREELTSHVIHVTITLSFLISEVVCLLRDSKMRGTHFIRDGFATMCKVHSMCVDSKLPSPDQKTIHKKVLWKITGRLVLRFLSLCECPTLEKSPLQIFANALLTCRITIRWRKIFSTDFRTR